MENKVKREHTIDTRFTWNGTRAKEFLELVKEEYGIPLPYGAVRQLVRLACAKFVEANSKMKKDNNNGKTEPWRNI